MINLKHIYKSYGKKRVLSDFNMNIAENEFVAIAGKSGSGKTTLINIIGCIDKPDKGDVEINGIINPNHRMILNLRRNTLGYIFQNYVLMEEETVKKNLELSKAYNPLWSVERVNEILELLELDKLILSQKVYELSGGEQQRIALARALLKPTNIILADEPTGNLDEENTDRIIKIFQYMQEKGKTIVCVTHNERIVNFADRKIKLEP
ncbi:ABC transporter ATP-binding protein [Faecalicatena contorta]|uniref:Putative ABC transport system ATP-binding protein n=1 Tax=Faecalicatena contorta TaxID=39482 RepID=A0A315ZRN9_9FIRM|nr:ABC transporter ATP-binding protein [Faecalicatena contorta]PWJ47972.1 putative ABC transport system ATP-binding protein [Faecalicatena contorta]SUQ15735.1 putative ABC transport system ATP-binding protein [Faecalicatena contorta]